MTPVDIFANPVFKTPGIHTYIQRSQMKLASGTANPGWSLTRPLDLIFKIPVIKITKIQSPYCTSAGEPKKSIIIIFQPC